MIAHACNSDLALILFAIAAYGIGLYMGYRDGRISERDRQRRRLRDLFYSKEL